MEFLDAGTLAFLLFFGFMAAFIDSVVGGGGLISVPAVMDGAASGDSLGNQ